MVAISPRGPEMREARVGNLDTLRRDNMAVLLGLLHRQGRLSRSALTAGTGLNRTTIGDLVGELAELGLVAVGGADANQRMGRPSPIVSVHPQVVAVAVQVETDAVTVGIVGLDGVVRKRARYETDLSPTVREAALIVAAALDTFAEEIKAARLVAGIGVSAAGPARMASSDASVETGQLGALLEEITGRPVLVSSEGAAGALAERVFGVGRDVGSFAYLHGGPNGVSGGIVIEGAPLFDTARTPELGGQVVGFVGNVPLSLSAALDHQRLLDALELPSATAREIELALGARLSSRTRGIVEEYLRFLALGVANIDHIIGPDAIVLGGTLASLLVAFRPQLEAHLASFTTAFAAAGRLRPTTFGDDLSLMGAAELAFRPLLIDPSRALRL